MKHLVELIVLSAWVCGVVLAGSFWSTGAAIFFPPWALYLVAERALQMVGAI